MQWQPLAMPADHEDTAPNTLRKVAQLAASGAMPYQAAMKEFIDGLIRVVEARGLEGDLLPVPATAFAEEPPLLDQLILRAHLAGVAEHLAMLSGQPVPEWCGRPDTYLPEPVYSGGQASRELVVRETPSAFARRNLFCGPALGKLTTHIERMCQEAAAHRPPRR